MAKRLGELLKDRRLVDEADLLEALREGQLGLKTIKLGQYPLDPEVAMLVPRQTCEKFVCVPLAFGPNNTLHVAVSDSLDQEVVQYLKFGTGKHILTSLASAAEIWDAIDRMHDFGKSLEEIMANVEVSGAVEL